MKNSIWMTISGITGFTFFLIANFTELFTSSSVIAGCVQLIVNGFVFLTWSKGFMNSSGLKKFVAFWGVMTPLIMGSVTLFRVILPAIFN